MALVFAVRGNSLNARYSTGTNIGFGTTSAVTSGVDAGALSGSLIDLTAATNKCLIFNGYGNAGESRAFSVLLRLKANYTGFANIRTLFQLGMGRSGTGPFLEFWHANATGNITAFGNNEANTRTFNSASFGSWNPTSGTYYDLFFSWDGTTTANAAKFYIDAVSLGNATAGAALTASWKSSYFNPIHLATTQDVTIGNYYLDEFVIWDSVEVPTNITLVSGAGGSLNGASRTSLVDCVSIDKSTWTTLAAGNIRSGSTQTQAGATVTGTLASPALSDIKIGVAGDGGTGTYDGSDRWTDVGIANVRLSSVYKANSTSNNRTGTLDLPATSNVKSGVVYDNTTQTGTYVGAGASTNDILNALLPFLESK